jgi:hypothetical protein
MNDLRVSQLSAWSSRSAKIIGREVRNDVGRAGRPGDARLPRNWSSAPGVAVHGAPCRADRTPQKPHNFATRWPIPTGTPRTKRHTPVHLLYVLKARRTADPAIPWKRGHFPLADSCNFGSSSDYRTPVHLWFLALACAPGTGSPDAPRPGRGRPGPARVSGRRGRRGLRGQGRPRRGRRRQAVRSSLEAGGAAPYPRAARPPAWNAAASHG